MTSDKKNKFYLYFKFKQTSCGIKFRRIIEVFDVQDGKTHQ